MFLGIVNRGVFQTVGTLNLAGALNYYGLYSSDFSKSEFRGLQEAIR
jgi:hypothetical protein